MLGILSKRRERERRAYEFVAQEIASGIKAEGLWLKAMSEANFDPEIAKAKYVRLRVENVLDDWDSLGETNTSPRQESFDGFGSSGKVKTKPSRPRSHRPKPVWRLSAKTRARLRGMLWISLGIVAYQAFGWLILGETFTIRPLDFALRIYYRFRSLGGDLSITLISSSQLVLFFGFIFKGIRIFRSRGSVEKSTIVVSETGRQAGGM